MHRIVLWILPLLLLGPALRAGDEPKDKPKSDKPASPAEELKALVEEFQDAFDKAEEKADKAETPAEKQKVREDFKKKSQAYAGRFLKIAQKSPKDKVGFEALARIVANFDRGPEFDKAVDMLVKDHEANVGPLCLVLARTPSVSTEKFCRAVLAKSKDHKVLAQATFCLALYLKSQSELAKLKPAETAKLLKEAEDLFDKIVKKYADVEGLVESAKSELFEIRNLAIGKEAPDFSGEDSDGKKFKLSDYRGKVVLLDFWFST